MEKWFVSYAYAGGFGHAVLTMKCFNLDNALTMLKDESGISDIVILFFTEMRETND